MGAKYGHKLMYVQGKEEPRNDVIYFGDKRAAFSTQALRAIAANPTYWAVPVVGAGGPVLVEKLGATGKAQHGAVLVLKGQKTASLRPGHLTPPFSFEFFRELKQTHPTLQETPR